MAELLIFTSILLLGLTLLWCFTISSQNGHLQPPFASDTFPTISALGKYYPEHIVFGVGITLAALFLIATIWYRGGQVMALGKKHGMLEWALIIMGTTGSLSLITMSWTSTIGSNSVFSAHSILAVIAIFLVGLSILLSNILWLVRNSRQRLDYKKIEMTLVIYSTVCVSGGLVVEIVWLADNGQTELEWIGFTLIILSVLPYFWYFSYPYEKYDLDR